MSDSNTKPKGTPADADLDEIAAWAMVDRKTILPADLFHLRNVLAYMVREVKAARAAVQAPAVGAEPIDMVLHCPACGEQHIDAPEEPLMTAFDPNGVLTWTNPPHRSHLCHECGHVWRPADVPTNGVAAVKTKGKADSPVADSLVPVQSTTDL